jgi:nitrate/TMAO reductase-like tetraheme cytochrome c subunit
MLSALTEKWELLLSVLLGIAIGMTAVAVRIANASSYLFDDPAACINCHVMTDAYATWQRGSHGRVTVCADCQRHGLPFSPGVHANPRQFGKPGTAGSSAG